jgi:hypothetical protein
MAANVAELKQAQELVKKAMKDAKVRQKACAQAVAKIVDFEKNYQAYVKKLTSNIDELRSSLSTASGIASRDLKGNPNGDAIDQALTKALALANANDIKPAVKLEDLSNADRFIEAGVKSDNDNILADAIGCLDQASKNYVKQMNDLKQSEEKVKGLLVQAKEALANQAARNKVLQLVDQAFKKLMT